MKQTYIIDIDHIGIAAVDIMEAQLYYKNLGYNPLSSNVCVDNERNVKILFMKLANQKIELVSPINDGMDSGKVSPVDRFLKSKSGYSIYHICYNVSDMEKQIMEMKTDGYMLLHDISPAPAMGDRKIAYMYHRKLGLIELAEAYAGKETAR